MLQLPLKKSDIEYLKGYSCVYSLTKSEVPFVTPIVNADGSPNHNFVVLGGMSGVGAKGAMTYGQMASKIISQQSSKDSLYNAVMEHLGFERLKRDIKLN